MKKGLEKMKIIRSTFILFLAFSFLNASILKGMPNDVADEISSSSSSTARLSLSDESIVDVLESTAALKTDIVPLDEEGISMFRGGNVLSNSYLSAFQNDTENGISRSELIKYIVCLVGGFGPFIPQIAIAKKIAESYKSKALGYVLLGTSALSIEAITAWMIWELIDDTKSLIRSSKQDQAYSSNSNSKILKNVGIGLSSLILGVLSSAPDVYIKHKYNNIKWFALISLVYDSIPRIIGFYKLFSSLELEKIKRIFKEPNIIESQGVRITSLSKAYFLQKCSEGKVDNVSEFLNNSVSPEEIYSYLTSDAEQDFVSLDSPKNFARGIPRKGVKYLSVILPIASAAFNTIMAYKGFKVLINNEPLLWILSTFSVTPALFLTSYVMMEASGNVFDKAYLFRSKIPSSDYFSSFHPKVNIVLLGGAFILASVTSFSTFYLISENLNGTILAPIKYGIAALAVGTDFTFGTYTIYTTFKRYGELACKKVSNSASYVINCSKKLSELGNSLFNFSLDIISGFINDVLPEDDNITLEEI